MSVRDKMKGIFQIDGGDDEFYDDDDGYLDEPEPLFKKSAPKESDVSDDSETVAKRIPRVSRGNKRTMGNGMEVVVVKPTMFEDAREITETLLANRTVVLNLEGLDVGIAQRIIDFASGSCFAMSGNLQKISHYIFLITPPSVDISGDFQDLISGTLDVEISR
ncbi:MAG: cell division protein SepF [Lachnospiraceae bacterium]|nr:cell division protein SepF [Lachnospiraceae bacterium]